MMCTKCKVQMEVGTAIQTDNRRERSMDFCQQILNHKTLELISMEVSEVWAFRNDL